MPTLKKYRQLQERVAHMFRAPESSSNFTLGMKTLKLIYHATVREVRKNHDNAIVGLLMNILQTVIFVAAFFVMFSILGIRGAAIRGDFLLYIMTGIFLFMTHTKAMAAVVGSEGPTSPMMKHRTMNTMIAVCAAALSSLYTQMLSMVVVLGVYHLAFQSITIYDPVGAMEMVLLAWLAGVAIGMVFLAIKPWSPNVTKLATTVFSRANMILSGKMFVANQLPSSMLAVFSWNPLFHTIDQARGHTFINYYPLNSSATYPLYVAIAFMMLGLMGEFYTRKRASVSWSAKL